MNIFYLDPDPRIAAQYHCDKHVIKMILESAQLLCTAINYHAGEQVTPYKSTHVNHPCAIWIRESYANWSYVLELMLALRDEWQYRYEHTKVHKSVDVITSCCPNIYDLAIKHLGFKQFTTPALAMPEWYKIENDPVASYRNYYKHAKSELLNYTRREAPAWLTN